jgi:hypothetical protein
MRARRDKGEHQSTSNVLTKLLMQMLMQMLRSFFRRGSLFQLFFQQLLQYCFTVFRSSCSVVDLKRLQTRDEMGRRVACLAIRRYAVNDCERVSCRDVS